MKPAPHALQELCHELPPALLAEHLARLDDNYFGFFQPAQVQRHLRALASARDHVAAACTVVSGPSPALDLFAEELRLAQQALGEITGEFTADDLLGVIFSRFCIGK